MVCKMGILVNELIDISEALQPCLPSGVVEHAANDIIRPLSMLMNFHRTLLKARKAIFDSPGDGWIKLILLGFNVILQFLRNVKGHLREVLDEVQRIFDLLANACCQCIML